MIILIGLVAFLLGCIVGNAGGSVLCMVGLLAVVVGVVKVVVKGVVHFWLWGTGRLNKEGTEEEEEEEEADEAEPITLEEVARIAEIAVLRRMVAMVDRLELGGNVGGNVGEQNAPSAPQEFPKNIVIQASNDEDVVDNDADEEEAEVAPIWEPYMKEAREKVARQMAEARARAEIEVAESLERNKDIPLDPDDEADMYWFQDEIKRLQKYLGHLEDKKAKLEALGTKETSRTWRSNEYDIEFAKKRLEQYRGELINVQNR